LADAELLHEAVREAGELARALFQQKIKRWTKSDGSPVTEADLAVDKILKARLHGARPDYGWLSEETPDGPERLGQRKVWIVDPIDGTRAFAHGGDEWCVAAALLVNGRPKTFALGGDAPIYQRIGDERLPMRQTRFSQPPFVVQDPTPPVSRGSESPHDHR